MPVVSLKNGTKSRSLLVGNDAYTPIGTTGLFVGGNATNRIDYFNITTTFSGRIYISFYKIHAHKEPFEFLSVYFKDVDEARKSGKSFKKEEILFLDD